MHSFGRKHRGYYLARTKPNRLATIVKHLDVLSATFALHDNCAKLHEDSKGTLHDQMEGAPSWMSVGYEKAKTGEAKNALR